MYLCTCVLMQRRFWFATFVRKWNLTVNADAGKIVYCILMWDRSVEIFKIRLPLSCFDNILERQPASTFCFVNTNSVRRRAKLKIKNAVLNPKVISSADFPGGKVAQSHIHQDLVSAIRVNYYLYYVIHTWWCLTCRHTHSHSLSF